MGFCEDKRPLLAIVFALEDSRDFDGPYELECLADPAGREMGEKNAMAFPVTA